jgi:hypothetical protein
MPLWNRIIHCQVLFHCALANLGYHRIKGPVYKSSCQALVDDIDSEREANYARITYLRVALGNRGLDCNIISTNILLLSLWDRYRSLSKISCKPVWFWNGNEILSYRKRVVGKVAAVFICLGGLKRACRKCDKGCVITNIRNRAAKWKLRRVASTKNDF